MTVAMRGEEHAVSLDQAGRRLDTWLSEHHGTSRTAAQALIEQGFVLVDARPARSGSRLRRGQSVTLLPVPERAAAPTTAATIPLRVVAEDEWLAVIDKPAGLVVHPGPGHGGDTLADALLQRGDGWSRAGGPERAGIVHRLDRWTSGLLVVAKTDAAHRALAAQLANRSMRRTYWALVRGGVNEDTGTIDAPIGRDRTQRQRMAVVDGGRAAWTDFRVLERYGGAVTALELSLRSGRTHQIRVHCAWIGRPLVGDGVYGPDRESRRPALHATRLAFAHPADGEVRTYESPLPADLQALRQRARAGEL